MRTAATAARVTPSKPPGAPMEFMSLNRRMHRCWSNDLVWVGCAGRINGYKIPREWNLRP